MQFVLLLVLSVKEPINFVINQCISNFKKTLFSKNTRLFFISHNLLSHQIRVLDIQEVYIWWSNTGNRGSIVRADLKL